MCFLFSPSPIWSANFKTKYAQNLRANKQLDTYRVLILPYIFPMAYIGLMGSEYCTIAIAVERFLAVTYPFLPRRCSMIFSRVCNGYKIDQDFKVDLTFLEFNRLTGYYNH